MKRIYLIIVTVLVTYNLANAQNNFKDTIEANNAGFYQSKELLQKKQTDYKNYKINQPQIKVGNKKVKWYIKDTNLSEYGELVKQGWLEKKPSQDFDLDEMKAKDGFEKSYTLYKTKQSDWNSILINKGWKDKKSEAGDDCVEIQVKRADGSDGILYGKLDETKETKSSIAEGYVSASKKETGHEYDEKEIDVQGVKVTLYKKKTVATVSAGDTAKIANMIQTNEIGIKNVKTETDKKIESLKKENEKALQAIESQKISDSKKEELRKEIDKRTKDVIDSINGKATNDIKNLEETNKGLQRQLDSLAKNQDKLLDTIKAIAAVAIVLIGLVVALIFMFFKMKAKKNNIANMNTQNPISEATTTPIQAAATTENKISESQTQPMEQPQHPTLDLPMQEPEQQHKEKPVPPPPAIITDATAFAADAGEWIVVGASAIGKGHISAKMPCQDNHKYEYLGEGWGIAITSDGAGSAENSQIGSKLIVERGVVHFKSLIEREGWMKRNELPSDAKWLQLSYSTLKAIRNDMESVAKTNNVELKSLSATAIVVIHTPEGILATHVGDGRAGYKNEKGEWNAIITPHKGEEANQTIFLQSDFWNIPNYVMSGVLVPESVVVRKKPFAFTLMSDGCESTAWLYNQKDSKTGKYYDPNKPYLGFFSPLEKNLQSFRNDKIALEERKEKWQNFIVSGIQSFANEPDDKTMILGVLHL